MAKLQPPIKVEVRPSDGKGLGVFANYPIKAGETIEDCHLIFLPISRDSGDLSLLKDYKFNFPARDSNWTHQVIPLGFGAIYNHSDDWNTEWVSHPTIPNIFTFRAVRDIQVDEECCTYYGNFEFP
jgi:SET domain-containing protein